MHASAHAIGPHEPRVASKQDPEAGLSSTSRAPLFDIQYAGRAHGAATAHGTIDSGPVHHNLPAHSVHLIGRKHDLAIARTDLLETDGRLLTMTGTGGCGKTHLFRMADHPRTKARVNDWTEVAKKTLGHPYPEQSEPNTTG